MMFYVGATLDPLLKDHFHCWTRTCKKPKRCYFDKILLKRILLNIVFINYIVLLKISIFQ